METKQQLPDVERLYVDSVNTMPVDYDWSEGYAEKWDYIAAPDCPECGTYARWISGADLADEHMTNEEQESDDAPEWAGETWDAWRCPNPECDQFGAEIDPLESDNGPMMNYYYPLPSKSFGRSGGYDESDAEKIAHLPLAIVTFEDSGEQALALSGGGMDLSWEICEAFMRLGHLPPAKYAELPGMAGRPRGAVDLWILKGCKRTFDVQRGWADGWR